jgi:hypothetical protein
VKIGVLGADLNGRGLDRDRYANSVAADLSVRTTAIVRDLSDSQMRMMQNKIVKIEGTVP